VYGASSLDGNRVSAPSSPINLTDYGRGAWVDSTGSAGGFEDEIRQVYVPITLPHAPGPDPPQIRCCDRAEIASNHGGRFGDIYAHRLQ